MTAGAGIAGALAGAGELALGVAGLALLGALAAAVAALLYRWYARERVPAGVALLVGLSAVTVYLNALAALGAVIAGETALISAGAVIFNTAALVAGALAAPVGRSVGDRVATGLFRASRAVEVDDGVGRFVRVLGRVTAVTLPEEIEDMSDHDPVEADVKAALAGATYLFPRGLSAAERRERLVARIKEEHGVGYVDADLDGGRVTYLAVGARQAGLGPTLPPGSAAVAVAGDPSVDASPGDLVSAYATDGESPERLATAELRATREDAVTLAVDAADAPSVAGRDVRLLTHPDEPADEREFASLLRTADETLAAVEVRADGPLAGRTVGDIDATAVAVRPADGPVEPVPPRGRSLAPGDTVYVVARPDAARQLGADTQD